MIGLFVYRVAGGEMDAMIKKGLWVALYAIKVSSMGSTLQSRDLIVLLGKRSLLAIRPSHNTALPKTHFPGVLPTISSPPLNIFPRLLRRACFAFPMGSATEHRQELATEMAEAMGRQWTEALQQEMALRFPYLQRTFPWVPRPRSSHLQAESTTASRWSWRTPRPIPPPRRPL